MKKTLTTIALATASAHAATITGTDTLNLATFTTADTFVTLTPFGINTTGPTTLNAAANFFGVNSNGLTNMNAVNDVDGDPGTTADQERLQLGFSGNSYLTGMTFAFSRADGPDATDGIRITGFLADPGVTVDLVNGGAFIDVRWDAATSSVFAELSGAEFNATSRILEFANPAASQGATLTITAGDSDQGNAQAAIRAIDYAIPEPSSLALLALGGLGLLRRRR